ncbi:MAG: ligase-associated DNA damage response endonuclease PdeM [Verrucomicrobiota bacterium]
MLEISFLEQTLLLYPERALYHKDQQTLLISDLHLGKSATFRASGIPVPEGSDDADLQRLTQLLEQTSADRLLILGDLIHAKAGNTELLHNKLNHWRRKHRELQIVLVVGNHDVSAGEIPAEWKIQTIHDDLENPPFVFSHHPRENHSYYNLAGHLHPKIFVRVDQYKSMKVACFYFGISSGILPAFGSFTGNALISPECNAKVYGIMDNEVVRLPQQILKKGQHSV